MNHGAYAALARYYDELTRDVPYGRFADFYEDLFRSGGLNVKAILDLACGTGTLTCLLAARGYDMTGADMSGDMLSVAYDKASSLKNKPLFLNQPMQALDLYGTVDAVVCSLDGINYVRPDILKEVFSRVLLFLEPGGMFIFDIRPPVFLRNQDGEVYLDETDTVYCVWRARLDKAQNALLYGMDLFAKEGRHWTRYKEEHAEYLHEPEDLSALLEACGFTDVRLYGDMALRPPQADDTRLFFSARKACG
jgi:ubiquinone/menaquinone biosynthesis C-methylase UbiE